ncbi:hypothetical protein VTJ04DRAFT_3840 [Mycothermus thermophilus]|uniref:uncharacterized protein n=1 Tax=Humicola insolens TaxID=85995 RepID=UPI003743EEB9
MPKAESDPEPSRGFWRHLEPWWGFSRRARPTAARDSQGCHGSMDAPHSELPGSGPLSLLVTASGTALEQNPYRSLTSVLSSIELCYSYILFHFTPTTTDHNIRLESRDIRLA